MAGVLRRVFGKLKDFLAQLVVFCVRSGGFDARLEPTFVYMDKIVSVCWVYECCFYNSTPNIARARFAIKITLCEMCPKKEENRYLFLVLAHYSVLCDIYPEQEIR